MPELAVVESHDSHLLDHWTCCQIQRPAVGTDSHRAPVAALIAMTLRPVAHAEAEMLNVHFGEKHIPELGLDCHCTSVLRDGVLMLGTGMYEHAVDAGVAEDTADAAVVQDIDVSRDDEVVRLARDLAWPAATVLCAKATAV